MSLVFVDTGGWIALLKRDDAMHVRARRYYEGKVREGARFLTTNYVTDETATRLRYDAGLRSALAFRDAVGQSVSERRLRVVWIDPGLERDGWALMEQYADMTLSLTDATTAAVARRSTVPEIFGFDDDFRALGFPVEPGTTARP